MAPSKTPTTKAARCVRATVPGAACQSNDAHPLSRLSRVSRQRPRSQQPARRREDAAAVAAAIPLPCTAAAPPFQTRAMLRGWRAHPPSEPLRAPRRKKCAVVERIACRQALAARSRMQGPHRLPHPAAIVCTEAAAVRKGMQTRERRSRGTSCHHERRYAKSPQPSVTTAARAAPARLGCTNCFPAGGLKIVLYLAAR